MINQTVLDELWNFDNPELSAERFGQAIENVAQQTDQDEFKTQLARALGLQGEFEKAEEILSSIGLSTAAPVVRTRVALERGRLANSSGRSAEAPPHFTSAAELAESVELAEQENLEFLRIDALHMLAIVDHEHAESWARQGLLLAENSHDPRTQRWAVSLHNNLGWTYFDAGELARALPEFEAALHWAQKAGTEAQRTFAQQAIEECQEAIAAQA
ncbi:tetratricopeptide (TPR) repeat protein [Psychromicrobium silvestre]|uniref:Tetratricopeptide (TPR) repeat protein n=1 Tax=Psychromicrobium silvestre TaxID=1645614 RepID=A0A7Y9S6C3_9MICC|nr:tetratricopeptide repeat protein [Psychromicrobium silvestre]NYE95328.1 tetratricopeptide (TPR) repeat protein [Psychromicrobium silvestre]